MTTITSDSKVLEALGKDFIFDDSGDVVENPKVHIRDMVYLLPGTRRVAGQVLAAYAAALRASAARKGFDLGGAGYTDSVTIRAAIAFFGNSGWFGDVFFVASGGRGIVRFWGAESPELPSFAKGRR